MQTLLRLLIPVLCLAAAGPVMAQENPYIYVKMSLGIPWFLYFVFLACILIPFAILIIVAWRRYMGGHDDNE